MGSWTSGLSESLITKPVVIQIDQQPSKMLYLVGLGLADETDITLKGLQIVKQADRVYLEAYTSVLLVDKAKLVRSCSFPSLPFLSLPT
jgi:Tetrapyrrole (Corrin/Porphyrin) Methylases